MNELFKLLLGIAVLAAVFSLQPAKAGLFDDEKELHLIVIETAQIYTEEEEKALELTKLAIFRQLVENAERQSSDTIYDIIVTSKPNTSLFRGNAAQLAEEGRMVLEASELQPTCNGLAVAWGQAARTIDLLEPDRIIVTAIGPAIDTGLNCGSAGTLSLPRAFPASMPLAAILADPRTASFQSYMVHGDQVQMLIDHISSLGAWDRKQAGNLEISILSLNPTITALGLSSALR